MTRPIQSGVSLIEVLISLLILSIGLLGVAGLHSVGISQNHSAWMRSQVTHFSYDIVDRMRANREAALAGDYDFDFPDPAVVCDPSLEPSGTMAEQDIAEWQNLLACSLPAGQGQIERDDRLFTITVRWRDDRHQDAQDGMLDFTIQTEM